MIRRQPAPMAIISPQQVFSALRASRLFTAAQLAAIESIHAGCDEADVLLDALVCQGMLTAYQVEQIRIGFGDSLVLGQYAIVDRLGEGGMAQVYKAEHIIMKRQVALKVIATRPWNDPEHAFAPSEETGWSREDVITPRQSSPQREQSEPNAIDRFHQEVRIAAQLDHPNIVRAFDAAEASGLFFLVMEYVDGIDLGRRVSEEGPLPVALACDYIRQAARGLQYAHERSLIHRDIKPSNLLLSQSGVVKILDLGLARLAGAVRDKYPAANTDSDDSGLAGTPDYMAPETAQDSRCADIRSDLYSLGCTFYFLLTGQVPYPGGGWPEKLLRHQLDSAPSVYVMRPDVPPEVSAILQCLMAKDPANRFATPADAAMALERWLAADVAAADPVPALLAATASNASTPTMSALPSRPKSNPPAAPVVETAMPVITKTPSSVSLHRWRRSQLAWPVGVAAAAILGLTSALMLHTSVAHTSSNLADGSVAPSQARSTANHDGVFTVAGSAERYATLAAAVAAAPDEGTITIHSADPLLITPLSLHGKSLTIRAAEGCRPRLQATPRPDGQPWQPLLAADHALRLEGLDLVHASDGRESSETTHLVYVEKAALHMKNCRLSAPHGSALVVCRSCRQVQIEDSQLEAAALALCVETSGPETDVLLRHNTVETMAPCSAALSLWSAEPGRPGTLRLRLEQNTIQAGRALAFGVLPARIDVTARANHFSFHEALVSYIAGQDTDAWRRSTAWQGGDNVFDGGDQWLLLNGAPVGIHDLRGWQALWDGKAARAGGNGQAARAE
jgi:serine/threonine-protein kinase